MNNSVKLFWIWTSGSGGNVIDSLAAPLFGGAEPFVQFWYKASWGTILWNNFEFGPVVQEMPFKDIYYLELWRAFCSAEWNHSAGPFCWTICAIFSRGQEEQFCEILKLDQWFRSCLWRIILIWCPGGPFIQQSNFGRGHYEEQFCEFILNLGQWFRCRLKDFLSGALASLLLGGAEQFMQFWKRASLGTFVWSNMKFGPVVQEVLFKQKVHNTSPWAFGLG